jgi:RNA polymerase sigma factor (sigma-70 family)
MPPSSIANVAKFVQQLAVRPIVDSDAALLTRFVKSRDEDAFAALVERHAPLARNVCRRLLGDVAAVDDIVQATFIVLANKAASIRRAASLSSWLYGTAHRLTRNYILRETGLRARERRAAKPELREVDQAWHDLQSILDDEVRKLPESLRGPILLCYIDGRTRDEAARQMGLSVATLSRRLEKGRSLLRCRLERRGIAPALALTAFAVSREKISAATVRQIAMTALYRAPNEGVAVHLASALGAGSRSYGRALAGIAAVACILVSGIGEGAPPPNQAPAKPQPTDNRQGPRVDADGIPLPDGALARVGSTRWRHGGGATSLAVSPDGATIACVDFRLGEVSSGRKPSVGSLTLWDAATGRLKSRVKLVDAEPYGRNALTILADGTVVYVETHGCYRVGPKERAGGNVEPLVHTQPNERPRAVDVAAVSPDGRLFAVGRMDETVEVYDAVRANVMWREKIKGASNGGLAFSADNERLAVASFAGSVRVFEAVSGKSIAELSSDQAQVAAVAFSPDGKLLATQSNGRQQRQSDTLVIWDITTKTARLRVDNVGYGEQRNSLTFSPDGKLVATRGTFLEVKLIDTQEGKIVRSIPSLSGANTWAFSPQGDYLACGHMGVIKLWNLRTGKLTSPPDPIGSLLGVRFSTNGENLILETTEGISIRNWQSQGPITSLAPVGDSSISPSLSPDCKSIAACPGKGVIQIIDAETGKERFQFDTAAEYLQETLLSPDNARLLVGTKNVTYVIDVATRQLRWTFNTRLAVRSQAAISADSRWFAAPATDKTATGDQIVLCDLTTGKEVRRFTTKWTESTAVAFSKDGTQLAAVGYHFGPPGSAGTITIWDRETGNEIRSISHADGHALYVAFSPDGRMLATGGDDRSVRLWEVQTGIERRRIVGHKNSVFALLVAFSPDGRHLASASIDAPVLVWDAYSPPGAVAKGIAEWWGDLQSDSAHLATMGNMIANSEKAIAWCRDKIKPSAKPDEKRIAQLVGNLDDPAYSVRDDAERKLAKLGDAIEFRLRRELAATASSEKASRLRRLLYAMTTPAPERIATFRAMEAIERIGTSDARRLIEEWAGGDPDNPFTKAAGKSLERMTRQ